MVRRLLPPLRLTRGRLDGMTARDSGGGAGTRDGYEYILEPYGKKKKAKQKSDKVLTEALSDCFFFPDGCHSPVIVVSLKIIVKVKRGATTKGEHKQRGENMSVCRIPRVFL